MRKIKIKGIDSKKDKIKISTSSMANIIKITKTIKRINRSIIKTINKKNR